MKQSTRKRLWTSMFVLLYLLAMFLPVRTSTAADFADECGSTSVQSAHLSQQPASADDQVTIPKEFVDASVYAANWGSTHKDSQAVEGLIIAQFVAHYGSTHSAAETERIAIEFRDKYEKNIPNVVSKYGFKAYDAIVHSLLDIALHTPELAPYVPKIWNSMRDRANRYIPFGISDPGSLTQSAHRYSLGDRLEENASEILAKVHDCAQQIEAVAVTMDKLYQSKVKVSIRASAKQIIVQNPDLPILKEIRDRIGEDGAINISINELKVLTQGEFGKIGDSITEMQKTLLKIDKDQQVVVEYIKNKKKQEENQAIAAATAAKYKLTLEAAQSSIFIIKTLVGFIDPKLATQIATVGTSALKIADSLHGWLNAVSGLSGLDKLGSLSTIVMTGNVLGAVMNIVSLFGNSGPTPDQMILEEIGKLREQVNQLRTEMHERFDRIDKELNTIFNTMQERFNLIDLQLGKINGKLDEVQKSLVELDVKLSRIERNNFEFLNDLGRRPLLDAMNGGVGYQTRTGLPMPFQPDFVTFENVLHGWGTIHAFDALNAGPTQRNYSDSQVLSELSAYPVDANINYLNGWLLAHGLPSITNKRLASPRDWLFASRAYNQLAIEWPEHMKRIDLQRQAELDAIGTDLEAAMLNISTLKTPTGTVGNEVIFNTVLGYYQSKLDAMNGAIQAREAVFSQDIATQLQHNGSLDLYAGVDQPVIDMAPEVVNMTCGDMSGHGTYPAPTNLKALIPNFNRYNLADYLKLGTLSVCLSSKWRETRIECPQSLHSPEDCEPITFAKHTAVLTVYLDSVPVMSQSIEDAFDQDTRGTGVQADYTRRNWTEGANYKAQFEASSLIDVPTPAVAAQQVELLNTLKGKLELALAGYQQQWYSRAITEMNSGVLSPIAKELAGGKALLDSFVTLGLSRAVSNDDFVHAMLFGNQQLVDDSQIVQSYALSATQPITGAALLVNPRLVIGQVADKRIAAFEGLINRYLDAITAKTHVEALDYIANTRRELDLSVRIAHIEQEQPSTTPTPIPQPTPPTPTDTERVYLPLVGR